MEHIPHAVLLKLSTFIGTTHHQCSACSNALRRTSKNLVALQEDHIRRPWPACVPIDAMRHALGREITEGHYVHTTLMVYWDCDHTPCATIQCPVSANSPGVSWEKRRLWDLRCQIAEALELDVEPALRHMGALPSVAAVAARVLNGHIKLSLHFGKTLFGKVRFYPALEWPSLRIPLRQEAISNRIAVCNACLSHRDFHSVCLTCLSNDLCQKCIMPRGLGCVGCARRQDRGADFQRLRIRRLWFAAPRTVAV